MKSAEQFAEELQAKWDIGNSSVFCDEVEWDSADDSEVEEFIKAIQADALKHAAEIAGRMFDDPAWPDEYQKAGERIKQQILTESAKLEV